MPGVDEGCVGVGNLREVWGEVGAFPFGRSTEVDSDLECCWEAGEWRGLGDADELRRDVVVASLSEGIRGDGRTRVRVVVPFDTFALLGEEGFSREEACIFCGDADGLGLEGKLFVSPARSELGEISIEEVGGGIVIDMKVSTSLDRITFSRPV